MKPGPGPQDEALEAAAAKVRRSPNDAKVAAEYRKLADKVVAARQAQRTAGEDSIRAAAAEYDKVLEGVAARQAQANSRKG